MNTTLPALTKENEELTGELEQLHLKFLDFFTRHKDIVENESVILTSLYLEKLGRFQLELLEKQTEASRLRMKMKLIQAAINRNERPDIRAIENTIYDRLKKYYAEIEAQSASLDEAKKVLTHMISEEDTQKLKETFRVLCKRLHPDLNPNQTEAEKDLFIKVKAAYDLQRLDDLQKILLFLDESNIEKLVLVSSSEKKVRIEQLKKNILLLQDKIAQLRLCFPFNFEKLIFDEKAISQKQEEIRKEIQIAEEEIEKFSNIINIMIDE